MQTESNDSADGLDLPAGDAGEDGGGDQGQFWEGGKEPAEAAARPKVKVDTDDEGNVRVELPAPRKGSRKDRRASREATDFAALRAELAEVRQALYARPQPGYQAPPQTQPQIDPYDRALNEIRQEQEQIQLGLRRGVYDTDDKIEKAKQRFYELDNRSRHLDRERVRHEVREELQRTAQAGRESGDAESAILKTEFPDVVRNQVAMNYAVGLYRQMEAEAAHDRRTLTIDDSRTALRRAAERFGLRKPAATPQQQQRFGAQPGQAGGKMTSPGGIRLNKAQQRMALARFPGMEERDAYTKMAHILSKAGVDKSGPPTDDDE